METKFNIRLIMILEFLIMRMSDNRECLKPLMVEEPRITYECQPAIHNHLNNPTSKTAEDGKIYRDNWRHQNRW